MPRQFSRLLAASLVVTLLSLLPSATPTRAQVSLPQEVTRLPALTLRDITINPTLRRLYGFINGRRADGIQSFDLATNQSLGITYVDGRYALLASAVNTSTNDVLYGGWYSSGSSDTPFLEVMDGATGRLKGIALTGLGGPGVYDILVNPDMSRTYALVREEVTLSSQSGTRLAVYTEASLIRNLDIPGTWGSASLDPQRKVIYAGSEREPGTTAAPINYRGFVQTVNEQTLVLSAEQPVDMEVLDVQVDEASGNLLVVGVTAARSLELLVMTPELTTAARFAVATSVNATVGIDLEVLGGISRAYIGVRDYSGEAGKVIVVNTQSGQVVGSLPVVPNSIAVDPLTRRIYVETNNWPDELIVYQDSTQVVDITLGERLYVISKDPPFAPADQTVVATTLNLRAAVTNRSASTPVDVVVHFYRGNPDSGGTIIGETRLNGLPPGEERALSANLVLPSNVERLQLYARASIAGGAADANPTDNTQAASLSVYFTNFRHDRDAYSFTNGSVGDLTETDLLTYLADYDTPEIITGPLFAAFAVSGTIAEAAGHCYGMANSSLVYYRNPLLRPQPKSVFTHTLDEARAKIRTYHWYSLSVMADLALRRESTDINAQYYDTRESIRRGVPVLHYMTDKPDGILGINIGRPAHVVVAYKVVELEDDQQQWRDNRVYYYDNNFPEEELEREGLGETYAEFTNGTFKPSRYGYDQVYALSERLSISDSLRSDLIELARLILSKQQRSRQMSVSARGGADLLLTDSQGRRAGVLNGQQITEIPGAVVAQGGDVQTILAPTGMDYTLRISQHGTSSVSLAEVNSTVDLSIPTASTMRILRFDALPLTSGGSTVAITSPQAPITARTPTGAVLTPALDQTLTVNTLVYLPLLRK